MSEFRYIQGIDTKTGAERCYLSKDNLIQCSIYTPKKKEVWGKQETSFYVAVDKNSPEFKTEKECREYLNDLDKKTY